MSYLVKINRLDTLENVGSVGFFVVLGFFFFSKLLVKV